MLDIKPSLLPDLYGRGLNLHLRNHQIVVAPGSAITDEVRSLILENRDQLIQELDRIPVPAHRPLVSFEWDGTTVAAYRYSPSDAPILGGVICLDCETAMVEGDEPPPIALVSASDGQHHFLIHPDDLVPFVEMHRDRQIVFHNSAFDFWVIEAHLSRSNPSIQKIWIEMARRGQFHDTMMLDILLRIAANGDASSTVPRGLDKVVTDYIGVSVDKESPYRMRFAEIIGVPWSDVEAGFFEYAIKDAIATVRAYVEMHGKAVAAMVRAGFDSSASEDSRILPNAIEQFGPLTERLQTRAAIALAKVSRHGLVTDQAAVKQLEQTRRAAMDRLVGEIHKTWPGVLKSKNGCFELTKIGRRPAVSKRVLRQTLEDALRQAGVDERAWPRDQKGLISECTEDWRDLRAQVEFADKWFTYMALTKAVETLQNFHQPVIHSKYSVLQITGRTACSKPNMQNVPRDDAFRQLIVPSEGHFLMAIDYSYIELVTLAATLRCRYGSSRLADVIEAGIDPHCHTAAMLLSLSYEDFLQLKTKDPDQFKLWRSRAKAVNFGVPGGMSAKSLVNYAKNQLGVSYTLDQATEFRRKLIQDVYPELSKYLEDTTMEALAQSLDVPVETVWGQLDFTGDRPGRLPRAIRRALAGESKPGGEPYSEKFLKGIWDGLIALNTNSKISQIILDRVASPETVKQLFCPAATTLTGRIRANVSYEEQRNTPFQGLAADGAKIALSELVFRGFRQVGFVHDEFLVELRDEGGYSRLEQFQEVVNIVRAGMEQVTAGIPVKCEASLATCWSKSAKLIVEGDRVIPWSPEKTK